MRVFIRTRDDAAAGRLLYREERPASVVLTAVESTLIADLPQERVAQLRESGEYEVYDDIQFLPFPAPPPDPRWWERGEAPLGDAPWTRLDQNDVMRAIQAPAAWAASRGAGVTIAVVDTGTAGVMKEFVRRSSFSISPSYVDPWEDDVGHGTMCAAIACGSTSQGGKYDGVAPDATLLSARSTLRATDLYRIYEHLIVSKRAGAFPGGLVVSNSYGLYRCDPPSYPEGHPYVDLIRTAVAENITFVFAAGNNHAFGLCEHAPADCAPNSIWAANSIDEVITVGTVDWNGSNRTTGGEHTNSSRGPGQWSTRQDKPDVVAPTYGTVAWGSGYRAMEWWGTSGACPQVAGLAALMLAVNPGLSPERIRTLIRDTATRLDGGPTCVGTGLINCAAAVDAARKS